MSSSWKRILVVLLGFGIVLLACWALVLQRNKPDDPDVIRLNKDQLENTSSRNLPLRPSSGTIAPTRTNATGIRRLNQSERNEPKSTEPLLLQGHLVTDQPTSSSSVRAMVSAATNSEDEPHWIPTDVRSIPDGSMLLGPVAVPAASGYILLAWRPDACYYFAETLTRDIQTSGTVMDAGTLQLQQPTGLSVQLINLPAPAPQYLLRLERNVADSDHDTRPLVTPMVRDLNPDLANSLDTGEQYLLKSGTENLLVPIYPEPTIQLQLFSDSGAGSSPTLIALQPNKIRTVTLDIRALFSESSTETVPLRGRVLVGSSDSPLSNGLAERLDAMVAERQALSKDGSFRFASLPVGQNCKLRVTAKWGSRQRPLTVPSAEFEQVVYADASGKSPELTLRMPALRWIDWDFSHTSAARPGGDLATTLPLLQAQKKEGELWREVPLLTSELDVAAAHAAAALLDPGTYRIRLFLPSTAGTAGNQPILLLSPPVEIRQSDTSVRVQ